MRRLDRRLIERTIELANSTQEAGPTSIARGLRQQPVVGSRPSRRYDQPDWTCAETSSWAWWLIEPRRELIEVGKEAGAEMVCGTSLKAALDRDWDQQHQTDEALTLILQIVHIVDTWVQQWSDPEDKALADPILAIAKQVEKQDVQTNEEGKASLVKGVAKDRRMSVEDGQMRHGRKSRSVRVDGDTRHVLHDLDTGLIRAVGVTPANVPEASVTKDISMDLERQGVRPKELHIDRAYLSSHLVRERSDDLEVYCKAWPVRESKHFSKQAFTLDWERQIIRCPSEQEMPFVPGGVVHFPREACEQCPLKSQCTTSAKDAASVFTPTKPYSSSYESVSRLHKGVLTCVNEWPLSIPWPMWVGGKGGGHAIVAPAKISSICVAVRSSTISMFSLVPNCFNLSYRMPREILDRFSSLAKSTRNSYNA